MIDVKAIWRKRWPKEKDGPNRHSAGHVARFKRPYRRQRRNWRELVPEQAREGAAYG